MQIYNFMSIDEVLYFAKNLHRLDLPKVMHNVFPLPAHEMFLILKEMKLRFFYFFGVKIYILICMFKRDKRK